MKIYVSWDVEPSSLVKIYRRFKGAYYLHYQDKDYRLDYGDNKRLWNLRQFLPNCTV
jgi:hypothetical protein